VEGTSSLDVVRSNHRRSTKLAVAARPHQLATIITDIMKNSGSQAKPPGMNVSVWSDHLEFD